MRPLVRQVVVESDFSDGGFLNAIKDLVTDERSLYVLQSSPAEILRFSRTGDFVERIGGPGEGPGEFRSPQSLGWRGDSLTASDARTRRLTVFGPEGRPASTITYTLGFEDLPRAYARPSRVLADGSILAKVALPTSVIAAPGPDSLPMVTTDRDGSVVDTLGRLDVTDTFLMVEVPGSGGGTMSLEQLFPLGDRWDVAPDGSRLTVVRQRPRPDGAPELRLEIYRPEAKRWTSRAYEHEGVRLEDAAVDGIVGRLTGLFRSGLEDEGLDRIDEAELRDRLETELEVPEYWPAVTGVLLAEDGTVWLRREGLDPRIHRTTTDLPDAARSVVRWDVIDSTGRRRSTVTTPASFRALHAESDRLWGIEVGSLDRPRVVAYAIPTNEGQ